MTYEVLIVDQAAAEIRAAYEWLLDEAPLEADTWYDGLLEAIDTLAEMPKRCHLAAENEYYAEEIRQLLYGKRQGRYRILFTIEQQTVAILHVRHAARRYIHEEEDD